MSFWSNVTRFFQTTEQDVINVIALIAKEAPVIEADIQKALKWIANETPTIASDLQTTTALVTAVGATSNPQIAAAITAANIAVAGLNAFADNYNKGSASTVAVIDGYIALKQASAAASSAAAAAAASAK